MSAMKYERVKEKMIDTSASSVMMVSIWMPLPSTLISGITSGQRSSRVCRRPTR
ncbi:hypothetical protein D3C84_477580 [compost metagenome]